MIRPAAAPAPAARCDNVAALGPEVEIALERIAGIDPVNARQVEPAEIAAMAASLAAHGQIAPLVLRQRDGKLWVVSGGRRWRAFQAIAAGAAPGSVVVRALMFTGSDDQAREISLAENVEREPLHLLDEAEDVAALAVKTSAQKIAQDFGLTRRAVVGRIALAGLTPRAKRAWRDGRFGLEAARILCLARDAAAVDAILDRPDANNLLSAPALLKRELTSRAVPATCAAARFVGLDAYRAAGGAMLEDLFSDEVLLADRALLDRLERDKLAEAALAVMRDEGWGVLVDDPSRLTRVRSHLSGGEQRKLMALDEALAEPGLSREAEDKIVAERERIEKTAILRAVTTSSRHRYGVAVSLDLDGRLIVDRAIQLAGNGASSHAPVAGDPPSAQSSGAADGVFPPGKGPGLRAVAEPESDEQTFAADAAAAISPSPRPRGEGRGEGPGRVPRDAPLPAGARRIAEAAATRALGDVVAADLDLALRLCVAAFARAGGHTDPVQIERGHGPWSARNELAFTVSAAETHSAGLKATLAAERPALEQAFAALVAMATDLRGAGFADQAALIAAAEERAPDFRLRIAEGLDYPAFFRAAPRAAALRALNECGGAAMELGESWRDDDGLARQASLVARAKSWLPDFLRGDPK